MSQQINQKQALDSHLLVVKNTTTQSTELLASPTNFQIGLQSNPSDLTITGRTSLSTKIYSFNDSYDIVIDNHVTVATFECIFSLIGSPRPLSLNAYLPSNPRNGQIVIIKDFSGIAGTIPIHIFDASGNTIDGAAYKGISSPYTSLTFVWNTKWFTV